MAELVKYASKKVNYDRTIVKLHTRTKVRLAASTQDSIELRLVSPDFIFSSSIQFLSPKQNTAIKKQT